MARSRKAAVASKSQSDDATTKVWASLTWEDVDRWAGSRSASRGRSYQRQGRVTDLAVTEEGKLLATVMGTDRYVTSAWLASAKGRARKLESKCACPVGYDGCKHAVAVVLAYLDALAEGKGVPEARPDDRRWAKLSAEAADNDDDFGEGLEDEWDDDGDWDSAEGFDEELVDESDQSGKPDEHPRRGGSVSRSAPGTGEQNVTKKGGKRRSRTEWDEKVRTHIRAKSREELAEMVYSLVERFPELRAEFQERIALAEGDVARLVNQARRELHDLTAETGWRNHWNGEGHTPDYAKLKHKLERLVESGHYDEVVKLGEELIRRGIQQIEQSHDEGETAMEISGCLPAVFDALVKSSRPAPQKILYTIDAELQDEYDVIGDAADIILRAKWTRADWSHVADRLAERLTKMPHGKGADEFTRNYKRDRLSNLLLHALDRAGRSNELLHIYEAEARATGSYQRLVEYLLREGRVEDAERWAREGIEKTQAKWPGIASALREKMCELARRRKEWKVVAAHAARDFFESPSVRGFRELVAAAVKAKCGEDVRAAAMAFLESGRAPIQLSPERGGRRRKTADESSRSSTRKSMGRAGQRKTTIDPAWPLPVPEYLAPVREAGRAARGVRATPHSSRPHYDVLLEMAIADKKPEEVLRWYDKMAASKERSAYGRGGWSAYGHSAYSDQVAAAVASKYPERALDIYRRALDTNLKDAHISAYENCAAYLRKMRPILKSLGREEEWTGMLADIRQNYRNRPRFMEILDTLEGRTIVQTRRSRQNR